MNVLLVGGSSSFMNHMIIKLNKEGHRVYLLTGDRHKRLPYQHVFERYDFTYDCGCLDEIFRSVNPDMVLYLGAFDSNYDWKDEKRTGVRYSTGLMHILMAYAMSSEGRFIYLSSHEVYDGHYEEDITEDEPFTPAGQKGMVLAQAEELCESYRLYRKKDIVTLRLDHLYSIPKERKTVNNICAQMCLTAHEKAVLTYQPGKIFSMIYETDAVEYIYQLIAKDDHKYPVYNITSGQAVSEEDVAVMVQNGVGKHVHLIPNGNAQMRRVLSNRLWESEFGAAFCCEAEQIIKKIADEMRKNRRDFLYDNEEKPSLLQRLVKNTGWLVKAMIPFIENIICFVLVLLLNRYLADNSMFASLDVLLLYVFTFAVAHGQQQATFAAVLAVIGHYIRQSVEQSSLEIVMDSATYVWIAQVFIVGLVVGYLKDQLKSIRSENVEEKEFLEDQINDIQDINSSNVRVKDALETQIVNQNDSVGKIYSITSALDQYSTEEVLFYAAEILARLMKSKDVAIYKVSNADYARLFSYTSEKAKSLGGSIRYPQMGEVYETLLEGKVYINRSMDERYPLMANAIWENDQLQILIFVWGIPWDHMTLGQANQLTVISSLIQNAVLRAGRYLAVLEEQRYESDSRMLKPQAFTTLVKAYVKAEKEGLTECTLLQVKTEDRDCYEAGMYLAKKLRLSDFIGTLSDGKVYVLLANTSENDAGMVMQRFLDEGYETEIVK